MGIKKNLFLAEMPQFLESPIVGRFKQENWDVFASFESDAEEDGCFQVNNIQNIIFFGSAKIEQGDFSVLHKYLKDSVKYHVGKFFFLSSMEVFSKKELPADEDNQPNPDTNFGKNYLLAEKMVTEFCRLYEKPCCILRTSMIYGPGQIPRKGNVAQRIVDSGFSDFAPNLNATEDYLYVDDFVFALYQAIARTHAWKILHLTTGRSSESKLGKNELGWTVRHNWADGWKSVSTWTKEYLKNQEVETKNKANWKEIRDRWVPYLENIVGFFLMLGIMLLQDGNPVNGLIYLDLNYIYIATMGIMYGKRQSVLACILSSVLLSMSLLLNGAELVSILYVPRHLLHFTSYLFTAVLTGYFSDQKKFEMESLTWDKEQTEEQYFFLKDVLKKTLNIKDNLYRQIVNSEDSIGRIYRIVSRLDRVEPENIFTQAAAVTADILDVRDVALYAPTKTKQFVRLKVCLKSTAHDLEKSKRVDEYAYLQELFDSKRMFVNNDLLADAPDMAAPILYQDEVVAVLEVRELEIGQWNFAKQNLLSLTCRLISAAIARAYRYEAEVASGKYVEDTRILTEHEFTQIMDAMKERRRVQGGLSIVLMRIKQNGMNLIELNERLIKVIRAEDFAGLHNGDVCLLLTEIDASAVHIVQDRLKNVGLVAETEEFA